MNEQQCERLLALLGSVAGSLANIERSLAPEAPNYKRPMADFADFDWASIGARVVKTDGYGPAQVEWQDQVFTRRSPENKFGEAIWFSRPDGKDTDGNNRYVRLITFKLLGEAEPLSRKVEQRMVADKRMELAQTELAQTELAQTAPSGLQRGAVVEGTALPPRAATPASGLPAAAAVAPAAIPNPAADAAFAALPSASAGLPPLPVGPAKNGNGGPKVSGGARDEQPPARSGAVAQASLDGGRVGAEFRVWAQEFVRRHPQHYQINKRDEAPDMYHLLKTAGSLGYARINSENLAQVKAALALHAAAAG